MSQYFSKPFRSFGGIVKVNIKTDLKNVTHVDMSSFALKPNLASFKTEVDKLDTEK